MLRIRYENLLAEFREILLSRGLTEENAEAAAEIFARNSLEGIYSHGVNRFPRMIDALDRGEIDPSAEAECVAAFGAMERWDGHRGLGPLNARKAMLRACTLAKQSGIGLVALGNNNHWLRGGTYGRLAADQGCIGICWSNTMPNMPAWGGKDRRLGNNPMVFAVPRSNGEHVVLDCAVSQFSYGKIEEARLNGKLLPLPGGYDGEGRLTSDPAAIQKTWRVLPMGYWKGSGISILLDLMATVLTDGNSVEKIGTFGAETGLSQVMLAVDPEKFQTRETTDQMIRELIEYVKASEPVQEGAALRYPGEREMDVRRENLQQGIPVNEAVWEQVLLRRK